jgi:hypothetical protein
VILKKEKAQNLHLGNPEQYGYHWIDLDKYYQIVNGPTSIDGTPEELEAKNCFMILNWRSIIEEQFN